MDVDLDFDPQDLVGKRGRRGLPLDAEVLRELRDSDLALLAEDRHTKAPALKRLTERHHLLARYLAEGRSPSECSLLTGYAPAHISVLQADSAFAELMAHYAKVTQIEHADFHAALAATGKDALNVLRDYLEAGELSVTQTMKLLEMVADRSGHGPSSTQNVKMTADIGARLDAARKRLEEKRAALEKPDLDIIDITPDLPDV